MRYRDTVAAAAAAATRTFFMSGTSLSQTAFACASAKNEYRTLIFAHGQAAWMAVVVLKKLGAS
jgi:hypothetical protein